MKKKEMEGSPVLPERNTTSSPSVAGRCWVPVDGKAGCRGQLGLSGILAAAEHPAEGWGQGCHGWR